VVGERWDVAHVDPARPRSRLYAGREGPLGRGRPRARR
jgi:hypothetical protein